MRFKPANAMPSIAAAQLYFSADDVELLAFRPRRFSVESAEAFSAAASAPFRWLAVRRNSPRLPSRCLSHL
jgi:hypothetical protein